MNFNQTHFTTSADRLAGCPGDSRRNRLCRALKCRQILRDQCDNRPESAGPDQQDAGTHPADQLFEVESGRYLVDLPGYGFAKVPLAVKDKWQRELEKYLRERETLAGLVVLSDIRHPMKEFDQQMVFWSVQSGLPVLLLLTKADKQAGRGSKHAFKSEKGITG